MTDFMQELVDKGLDVQAVKIQNGWLEFDTNEDYERALKWDKEKILDKFYKIN